MTDNRVAQVIESILTGDIHLLKKLIPDAATYELVINTDSANVGYDENGRHPVYTSEFLHGLVKSTTEQRLLEYAFPENIAILSYFDSLGVISGTVSYEIIRELINSSEDEAALKMVETFSLDSFDVVRLLVASADMSSNRVNFALLDKVTEDELSDHKDSFNHIISIARRGAVPLSPFFECYPGEIDEQEVMNIFTANIKDLDLSFEKITRLYPLADAESFILSGTTGASLNHKAGM